MASLGITKNNNLTLREWWDEVGTENAQAVFRRMGRANSYMRHLRYRYKRPGYNTAVKLVELAKEMTPGFAPSLEKLMEPLPKRKPDPTFNPAIAPSARFLKAQAARGAN